MATRYSSVLISFVTPITYLLIGQSSPREGQYPTLRDKSCCIPRSQVNVNLLAGFSRLTKLASGELALDTGHRLTFSKEKAMKRSAFLAGLLAMASGTTGLAQEKNPVVEMDTSMGKIKI